MWCCKAVEECQRHVWPAMKNFLINFFVIAIPILAFHIYCGWSGNGNLFIKGGFLGFLMLPLLIIILTVQWFRKRCFNRHWFWGIAPAFCVLIYTFAMYSSTWGVNAGRYWYWMAHQRTFERMVSELVSQTMPTQIDPQMSNLLGFPVVVCSDSSNTVRFVAFSHWRTTAYRDIGFVYYPYPDENGMDIITGHVNSLRKLSPNWYLYSIFRYHDCPGLKPLGRQEEGHVP
jgi:hypothetical protein